MKIRKSIRLAYTVASLVAGVATLATPCFAQEGNATTDTSTAAAPAMPTSSSPHRKDVEGRINQLHEQLKITAAQEDAWGKVAEVMRSNAASMRAAVDERDGRKSMTAVEDMKSYQAITQAHADGLNKLLDAFTPLYNAMDDAQKKNADKVFGQHIDQKSKH